MWAKLCRRCVFIVLAPLIAPASAQEKQDAPKEDVKVLKFEDTDRGLNICAMVACAGTLTELGTGHRNPWSLIAVRMAASRETIPLPLWQFDFREVSPLEQAWLDRTRDGRPLPKILYKDLKELGPDLGFYMSFNKAIERAHGATLDQFEKSAEEFDHVRYQALKATPGRFRGKVITVTGHLSVLRKEDTPRLVATRLGKEQPYIYTGWVEQGKKLPPYTVVFTQLPPEIAKESERLDLDVTFQGYFIAFVSFPTGKEIRGKPQEMFSPYLVGKTLVVHQEKKANLVPPPTEDRTPASAYILAWTVGAIVVVAVLVAFLNAWVRRGDRRIESRLAEMRDRQHPFNVEPAEESSMPPLAMPITEKDETNPADRQTEKME